jgi:hypothetical protein
MSMSRLFKAGLLCAAAVLIHACSSAKVMPDVTSSQPVAGKVILVGKFILNPPLEKVEKESGKKKGFLQVHDPADYMNTIFFSVTPQPAEKLDRTMMSAQWKNTLHATFGETYFKQADAGKSYLNAGMTYVDAVNMDKAWLPGFMSFSPPAQAKAVYIGTVRYTRDDFWNITKVQVIDEYKSARAEFAKRFGKSIRLDKALLRRTNTNK